jgi:hypothetical protein
MNSFSTPMGISRVAKHQEYDNILTITDVEGQDWHYHQGDNGQLVLGFPVQLYNRGDPEHIVHVFHPLGPGAIPILLRITHTGNEVHLSQESKTPFGICRDMTHSYFGLFNCAECARIGEP